MNESPAQRLLSEKLNGRWLVVERQTRQEDATGGNFSVGYIVEDSTGQRAFLKALDFSKAMELPNFSEVLELLTRAFNYEETLLRKCREHKITRVAVPVDQGTVRFPDSPVPVPFLVFPLAGTDIRGHPRTMDEFDLAWKFRVLHETAAALQQLHSRQIAHQDVKPSNLLVFTDYDMKLGDLGRAEDRENAGPHAELHCAGDLAYAPPELLYKEIDSDWVYRRLGCDLYHLGSMICFLFCGVQMTALIRRFLHTDHVWGTWRGTYRDVLPYVREAFGHAVSLVGGRIPQELRERVQPVLESLCEPDPHLRGHPLNRQGHQNPMGLERFVSSFDLLTKRAEFRFS